MWIEFDSLYEVSFDGHIRNKVTKRVIREFAGKDGYLRTQLHGKTTLIHRIIAAAFIQNPDDLPEVNHKDGNKRNNAVSNLEWVTRSENQAHAYKLGLKSTRGTKNGRHKLTEKDVEYIRNHYVKGDKNFGTKALSEKFGVARQTISAVICGQNWR